MNTKEIKGNRQLGRQSKCFWQIWRKSNATGKCEDNVYVIGKCEDNINVSAKYKHNVNATGKYEENVHVIGKYKD